MYTGNFNAGGGGVTLQWAAPIQGGEACVASIPVRRAFSAFWPHACEPPPQPLLCRFFCSDSNLHAARMWKQLFVREHLLCRLRERSRSLLVTSFYRNQHKLQALLMLKLGSNNYYFLFPPQFQPNYHLPPAVNGLHHHIFTRWSMPWFIQWPPPDLSCGMPLDGITRLSGGHFHFYHLKYKIKCLSYFYRCLWGSKCPKGTSSILCWVLVYH